MRLPGPDLGLEPERGHRSPARRADRIQLVFLHVTGLCLFTERLQDGRFRRPKAQDGVVRFMAAELQARLEGLDRRRVNGPREVIAPARWVSRDRIATSPSRKAAWSTMA
ncbi:IS66 family insertion sequence element accessory protein TnpB [Methylobacterium sp. JK268]